MIKIPINMAASIEYLEPVAHKQTSKQHGVCSAHGILLLLSKEKNDTKHIKKNRES
jgi:hypothetical protein